MTFYDALSSLPEGDLSIEVEHVHGGWVGYVCVFPVHGPMVPMDRVMLYARTACYPTRNEAVEAIPEAFSRLTERGGHA